MICRCGLHHIVLQGLCFYCLDASRRRPAMLTLPWWARKLIIQDSTIKGQP